MTRLQIIRLLLWSAVAVLTAATIGIFVFRETQQQAQAAIGGPFSLVDSNGSPVTEDLFAGKPHLVFFGFTHCPDVCPTTLSDFTLLLEDLGEDAKDLVIAFVTVDPERDTPAVMKSYLSSFSDRIIGLTGSDAQVAGMIAAYRAYRSKIPQEGGGYTMDHTASVYLFDASGEFRGTIDLHEDEATRLAKVRRLVGAAEPG
ncbi:SCO family protein [Methylobrevis pamukkalensis]|uniref:Thioredoxin domain-containing protein n=1 Tax=Methylobrevis pamukkalensis TaxID=1439726 RepID=A0A1E3H6V9_9HYPH|nr:SCO family protein [Methylobrevis pamukkalensis]ODN72068.1 hypothetical protein A6302_00583 [Methylobrevis pamukkalensis]